MTENSNNQTIPYEKALGESGKEELYFSMKVHLAEPDSVICHDRL